MNLTQRTRVSFESTDPAAVATMLLEHGFSAVDTCSQYEYARLRKGGALAVIYRSGSVLCQGGNPQPLISLLQLAVDQAEAVAP